MCVWGGRRGDGGERNSIREEQCWTGEEREKLQDKGGSFVERSQREWKEIDLSHLPQMLLLLY